MKMKRRRRKKTDNQPHRPTETQENAHCRTRATHRPPNQEKAAKVNAMYSLLSRRDPEISSGRSDDNELSEFQLFADPCCYELIQKCTGRHFACACQKQFYRCKCGWKLPLLIVVVFMILPSDRLFLNTLGHLTFLSCVYRKLTSNPKMNLIGKLIGGTKVKQFSTQTLRSVGKLMLVRQFC